VIARYRLGIVSQMSVFLDHLDFRDIPSRASSRYIFHGPLNMYLVRMFFQFLNFKWYITSKFKSSSMKHSNNDTDKYDG
jgi:hypothetical protein